MRRRQGRGMATSPFGRLRHRLRYRFDNLLARGTGAALVWLGAVTLAAVLISSVLLWAFGVTFAGSDSGSLLEDFWQSLLRVMDPGTMAGDVGWGRRVLALLVTIFGLLVAGTLIGVIAAGVEQRIERMQRGRSAIIESDHFVVLGDSERLPIVVAQLVLAGAGRGGHAIVVMADRDPAGMFDEVGRLVEDWRGSRLVIRSGDPTRTSDLALVRLDTARAVIVLAGDGEDVTLTSRILLAIGAHLGGYAGRPVIVEVDDAVTAATLVRACGPDVHPLVTSQAAARIAAFVLRRPGLGPVLRELLDFRGCDIHIQRDQELTGATFGALVGGYAKARPLGRIRPDGLVDLNPPPDTRIEDGDRLVVIADDASALERAPVAASPTRPGPRSDGTPPTAAHLASGPHPEHLLVIGWSAFGAELLEEWVRHAEATSTVEVVFDPQILGPEEIAISGIDPSRVTLTAASGVSGVPRRDRVPPATTIILLAYTGRLTVEEADTRTLLTLAIIRREEASDAVPLPRVLVELLDVDHAPLAEVGGDDYLISPAIADHLLAQLADSPGRRSVLLQLYGGDGPSMALIPAANLGLAQPVTAGELFAAAYAAGYLAIGWRRSAGNGGELVLNPHQSATVTLSTDDQVVVIG